MLNADVFPPIKWKWLWWPVIFVLTGIANGIIQSSVDQTAREAGLNLSALGMMQAASEWFADYWFYLFGWVLAITVTAILVNIARQDKRWEASRLLERTAQRLLVLRGLAKHPDAPLEDLKQLRVAIDQERRSLLDQQGKAFSPSIAAQFHRPSVWHVGNYEQLVSGLSHSDVRKGLLAEIDDLHGRIHEQWKGCLPQKD